MNDQRYSYARARDEYEDTYLDRMVDGGLADAWAAVRSWRAALDDHAHTSYYGVEFIRGMIGYWLGMIREARKRAGVGG